MKQTRSLSQFSRLSKYTRLYPTSLKEGYDMIISKWRKRYGPDTVFGTHMGKHYHSVIAQIMCHSFRYIIHFYCIAVEAGFYGNLVECLPVDTGTWVRFPAGTDWIFSLYDNGLHHK